MSDAALLRRIARAVQLDAVRLENGEWLVTGGATPHRIRHGICSCYDSLYVVHTDVGYRCKHQLKVALLEGDARAWALLRELVPAPRRQRRTVPR